MWWCFTAHYFKWNGGLFKYYKCPHCKKFTHKANKANAKFIEYIQKLKPKNSTLVLFNETINDLRKHNNNGRLQEIPTVQKELLIEEGRLDSIDYKFMDGELSSKDFQRMKSTINRRRDGIMNKLELLNPQNTNELEQKKRKIQIKYPILPFLYPEPGSNRHGRNGHRILSPACLPIPPSGHWLTFSHFFIDWIFNLLI